MRIGIARFPHAPRVTTAILHDWPFDKMKSSVIQRMNDTFLFRNRKYRVFLPGNEYRFPFPEMESEMFN